MQSYTSESGTQIIPGATADYTVATGVSGLSTTGVLMLVGEADAGPHYSLEDSLQAVSFNPSQRAAVVAKFGSGPLVDAFHIAATPANDANIPGGPSRVFLIKTNSSGKATAALLSQLGGAYQSPAGRSLFLADKSYGKAGNSTFYTLAERTAEVQPTTGPFTWLLPIGAVDVGVRANGGAQLSLNLTALTTPAQAQAAFDGLAGVAASGGTSRTLLQSVTGSLTLTVLSGNRVQVSYTSTWGGTTPTAGDTFYIPAGSPLAGGASQNVGSYVVVSGTTNSLVAIKLLDASGVPGALTAPVAVSSTAVTATTNVQAWAPLVITLEAGATLPGLGKTLEIAELTIAADRLSNVAYALSTSKVSWVSKSTAPALLVSGAEQRVRLSVNRQSANIQEELDSGGEVALKLGYAGTTATITITDTTFVTTVVGGAGESLNLELRDFPTIQDLATYVNTKPGYKCAVGTAILGQLPSSALDNVTSAGIATVHGEYAGRIKIDGYRFSNKIKDESVLVQLQDDQGAVTVANSGLPALQTTIAYLQGGTRGGTTDEAFIAALAALEKVRGNFVVPLFSRDATADITDRLTDSSSTYTIEGINSALKAHLLNMAKLKKGRNRQGFPSIRGTFSQAKTSSANYATFRAAMPFQDIRALGASGVAQFHPWAAAVVAAAMQAAAGAGGIVGRIANINGALQAARDFDDQDDALVEEALQAGLLVLRNVESGGWEWVSDQTTYGKDSNFVYNSVQATYAADTVALASKREMERTFKGKSTADITRAGALTRFDQIMGELKRLKFIAASDGAPKGYKNPDIKISGPAMIVTAEVKVATLIYFIPISFLVSQVEQTA